MNLEDVRKYPQLQLTIGSRVAGSGNSDYVISFTHKA